MTNKKNKKVLIIEDDRGMVLLLRKWLNVAGYEIEHADNGEAGLRRAQAGGFDIILLDLMLPGIGGNEVARQLKAHPAAKGIPIIFMTAYMGVENDKGDEQMEVDGSFYRVFAKPLHNRKLLSEMRKAINRHKFSPQKQVGHD